MTTTPTPTPRWLQAYTTTSGLPDPRLAGTTARPRHCTDCRRLVLAGYDSPTIATLAITDPYALTPQLETAAVLLDIPTWRLWGAPGRYELTPRHEPGLGPECTRAPASEITVVAAHRCEYQPLSRIPLPTPHAPTQSADPDRIPF